MNLIQNYYKRIIKQDLTNKFIFANNKKIPKLKEITLNFGCKNMTIQKFATTMLALEIISLKKSTITVAKKPNVLLKIQKGQPAGCKVKLRNYQLYLFLTKLHLEIIPRLRNFHGFKIEKQVFQCFFQIPGNEIILKEFENHYPTFSNLPTLDINIFTTTKNNEELIFLTKAIKLPFYQK